MQSISIAECLCGHRLLSHDLIDGEPSGRCHRCSCPNGQMHPYNKVTQCVFCKVNIDFTAFNKYTLIKIERDDDGAPIETKLWAHEDCLPTPIKEAL